MTRRRRRQYELTGTVATALETRKVEVELVVARREAGQALAVVLGVRVLVEAGRLREVRSKWCARSYTVARWREACMMGRPDPAVVERRDNLQQDLAGALASADETVPVSQD